MENFTDACLTALTEGQPYPSALASDPALTMVQAYELQRQFVAARSATDPISGYKAALTAPPAQQAMGIDQPIVGALLTSGAMSSPTLRTPAGGLLETELGHRLAQPVREPVKPEDVAGLVGAVHLMVEIAQPRLAGKPAGLDLVATNSASLAYIVGPTLAADVPLDEVEAGLADAEGNVLFSGACGTVMGGQHDALAWLINAALARCYTLEAGHLLMTGSVGGAAPARPGVYQARFQWGEALDETIGFELTA